MIRMITVPNYNAMSFHVARQLSAQIMVKPNSVLGLATGSSPVGAYQQMVADAKEGLLDFSEIRTVNLDEYWGLDGSHDQSYRYFMDTHLFDHVNIDKANTNVPNGLASSPEEETRRYDALIQSLGGVDLQLLGIGGNGHIGFNEPGDHFTCGTHVADLAPATIEANKRFFASANEVPARALTMGIRDIMQAKSIVLMASGVEKAQAIRDSFFGKITPEVPGSILQLHPNVTVVADQQAMSLVQQ